MTWQVRNDISGDVGVWITLRWSILKRCALKCMMITICWTSCSPRCTVVGVRCWSWKYLCRLKTSEARKRDKRASVLGDGSGIMFNTFTSSSTTNLHKHEYSCPSSLGMWEGTGSQWIVGPRGHIQWSRYRGPGPWVPSLERPYDPGVQSATSFIPTRIRHSCFHSLSIFTAWVLHSGINTWSLEGIYHMQECTRFALGDRPLESVR